MVKLYRDNNTKIFNPETGRYVKVTGTIGRRLERMSDEEYNNLAGGAGAGAGVDEGGVKQFSPDRKKILNPKSNKFVLVTGTMGRKLVRMSNDEYLNLLRQRPVPRQVNVDLKKVIREEQAKAIVRGVQRGDEYLERFRQQTVRLFDELPELIDDLVTIPRPTHNIRDVARMLIRPVLERSDTAETVPDIPMPALQRQETKLQEIEPEDLNVISEVADRLDEMIEQLENENEFDVGVEESKMEDVIVEEIQNKRKNRLNEIINNAQEGDLSTEEQWERVFDELYELEPVQDDKKGFIETWEEFADNLEKMFDEMIAEEKEKVGFEEEKEEKEQKQEEKQEEKQEMSGEDALEALRQNLMNLEILNSGRGAYQAHISNPDPHVDAFEHIEKHK